jgi:hypothetical protein
VMEVEFNALFSTCTYTYTNNKSNESRVKLRLLPLILYSLQKKKP